MSQAVRTQAAAPSRKFQLSVPPALRYPAYRNFWFGMLASVSGFQVLQFGQLWLVHELTGSPLFLGYVGLANAIPAIALNLFGGAFADKVDKRRLIVITQSISAALILLLATLTLSGWVDAYQVLAIAFVTGAVNAFDQPARQALYPHLIDRKVMMSAVALNSSIWQGTRIVAPAVAGFVIAILGTAAAFYLAALGSLVMAVVIAGLKVPRIERGGTGKAGQDILDGLKFIKRNSIFSFLIGMTFFNSFFGMAYIMMMPVFTREILNVGADGQGVLVGVGGVGALITTLWLGSRGNVSQRGLLLVGGAIMFGLSVVIFALTSLYIGSYHLAIFMMFVIGVFNSVYMISVMSSLQMLVPDRMRGRVMGFYGMTYSIMPLGGFQAGLLASYIGPFYGAPFAVAIGGLAVTAFALGPALVNSRVRNLGSLILQAEKAPAPAYQPAPSAGNN